MDRAQLLKIARRRLYPSLTNPNYLVLRSRRLIFTDWLSEMKADLDVLDVGGRYQPYRPLLEGKIKKYVGLDLEKTEFVDVVGSGECIPLQDESFDLVIATVVFEYFRNPFTAAEEIHRVLRRGGSLFMTVNSVAPRFVDEEGWRFMPKGLRSLFSNFSRVIVVAEVSSLGGLSRLINLGCHDLARFRSVRTLYSATLCPVINLIGLAAERARLTKDDRWTGNYSVMAVK